ncbi:hypothetical protein MMC25_001483 [Agyrium rufum]|nr:hypothetical protein [Agyrium rufum]
MLKRNLKFNYKSYIRNCRNYLSTFDRFSEGDRVILYPKEDPSKTPHLTKALHPDRKVTSRYGDVPHADLIGKRSRDTVITSAGRELRAYMPTLEQYTKLTPRMVTPIYPADANLIVSLLDIHVSPPSPQKQQSSLRILEAGTGHGALTLYLSRAIHAANPPPSVQVSEELKIDIKVMASDARGPLETVPSPEISIKPDESHQTASIDWKATRQAVIHTVDVHRDYSIRARQLVAGFRNGMYLGNIDFQISQVDDWIRRQMETKSHDSTTDADDRSFLSHALFDFPGSHESLALVSEALETNGTLVLFCPSISQIMKAIEIIKEYKLPLVMESVIETGLSLTGGKEWDVRAVKPRALLKKGKVVQTEGAKIETAEESEGQDISPVVRENVVEGAKFSGDDAGWEMICRPKVGERVIGGGFLGVWKKMKM